MKTPSIITKRSDHAASLGGKAEGLFFLQKHGLKVPEFCVIPFATLEQLIHNKLTIEDIVNSWESTVNPISVKRWAVRSSAEVEDGKDKSYAGMFTTVLNCRSEDVGDAILKVLNGFERARVNNYHSGEDFKYHIIIQEMISGDVSGVGFSINPLNYESNNPLINIIPGEGNKLVSGEENALMMEIDSDQNAIVLSRESHFNGEANINGRPTALERSMEDLTKQMKPYFKEMRSTLVKLEHIKGHPVDIEFTVANNQMYWLQLRPVTNYIPKGDYKVWDNSNVAMNYPGIVMPLTTSFVHYSYSNAYIRMARFLGASDRFINENYHLFKSMTGVINGAMYYNITSWQQLLYQLPFGKFSSKQIASALGARDSKFKQPSYKSSPWVYLKLVANFLKSAVFFSYYKKRYLSQYQHVVSSFDATDFSVKSHEELIQAFKKLEADLAKHWWPPMLNGLFTMLCYSGMKKWVLNSRIHKEHPNFLNDTLSGTGDVISVEIVRELQKLLHLVYHNQSAREIIQNNTAQEALKLLEQESPEVYSQIQFYILRYGERCDDGELKIETVNYKEDPGKFITFLKNNLKVEPKLPREEKENSFKDTISKYYRNPVKRWFINRGIQITINFVRNRENFRFIRTVAFDKVRILFRQMDRSLVQKGYIARANDSLYLELDELLKPDLAKSYKSIIENRKEEYASYENLELHDRYYEVEDAYYPAPNTPGNFEGDAKGVGCSSGTYEGEVVVVTPENVNEINAEGKIVVANFFEPGWIGLFSQAGGLIAERGSLLSHAAILCREMGVPAIMGASNTLKTLKNGDLIIMDGSTGQIETLS